MDSFTEHLGGRGDENRFTCNAPDRNDPYLVWLHNNMELTITEEKYELSNTKLTLKILNIDYRDDGNYSCKYTSMDTGQTVQRYVGCLTIYGELKTVHV